MRLILLAVMLCWHSSEAYRILCVLPVPSPSHHHLAKGTVGALLEAGHEVTWATPYPELVNPQSTLKVIGLSSVRELSGALSTVSTDAGHDISFMWEFARDITSRTMLQLRETLVGQQFDAVVTEWFFSDAEAAYAAVQQVPWVLTSSVGVHAMLEAQVDEVRSVAAIPHMMSPNSLMGRMSFWERGLNLGAYCFGTVVSWWQNPASVAFYEKQFGPIAAARGVPLPPFSDAVHNVSVLLVNSHPSFAPARSLPPNVVDIGGYHIDEVIPPLPKDLQELLDSSKCAVYFSMGSIFKSTTLSQETRQALLGILGRVPCLVLWKYEDELQELPKNVHVRKWMPQMSLLAHPKVKLFITHGGLLSVLEALHAGVPLLAIPVFGDQPMNAQRAVAAGFARTINLGHMAEDLEAELGVMMTDNRYSQKAQQLSKLFRKRPVSPKKLISHYVELAIESKGAFHLRSPSLLYAWYERWLLDVLGVLAIVFYTLYLTVKFLIRIAKRKLCNCCKKGKIKTG